MSGLAGDHQPENVDIFLLSEHIEGIDTIMWQPEYGGENLLQSN